MVPRARNPTSKYETEIDNSHILITGDTLFNSFDLLLLVHAEKMKINAFESSVIFSKVASIPTRPEIVSEVEEGNDVVRRRATTV